MREPYDQSLQEEHATSKATLEKEREASTRALSAKDGLTENMLRIMPLRYMGAFLPLACVT